MITQKFNIEDASIVAQESEKRKSFDEVKRAFELAYATGGDYGDACMKLAQAVALSVLAKCVDPQRKTAPDRAEVSNTGYSPALLELRRGLMRDVHALANVAYCAEHAEHIERNEDGDIVNITDDPAARDALAKLMSECLSDGIDLVQEAATALIEQAAEHADAGEGWLDAPYTVRRLSRRVLIRADESAAYVDETTFAMREVYRAVRRAVASSRAVKVDPRNGYTYIADMQEDGLDTVYLRMGKYADLGGEDCNGLYTAGRDAYDRYNDVLAALNLTKRQAEIVALRMRGCGYQAIATHLGIREDNVRLTLRRLRAKCEEVGFTPMMWAEMDRD